MGDDVYMLYIETNMRKTNSAFLLFRRKSTMSRKSSSAGSRRRKSTITGTDDRRKSIKPEAAKDPEVDKKAGEKLIQEEKAETGGVSRLFILFNNLFQYVFRLLSNCHI